MKRANMPKKVSKLAYKALERDFLNDLEGANEALEKFLDDKMTLKDAKYWAQREEEFTQL